MSKLIGQITYPQNEEFSVEYTKLYDENEGTTLEFCLVNRGKKTVNAYRVDISYSVNGEEKTSSVQGKNLELIGGSATDIITCTLEKGVEEGTITLSAVIYEDLTHGTEAPAYPFASFDAVSRIAESVLSGAVPTNTTGQAPKTVTQTNTANLAKGTVSPAKAAQGEEEPAAKASSLPLILSLAALGGLVLSFVVKYLFQF